MCNTKFLVRSLDNLKALQGEHELPHNGKKEHSLQFIICHNLKE